MRSELRSYFLWVVSICAGLMSPVAGALDAISLETGMSTDDSVARLGAAARWTWRPHVLRAGRWSLDAHWELAAGYWHGDRGLTGNKALVEAGVAPVLMFRREAGAGGIAPYIEAGAGLHLLSKQGIDNRNFDLNIAFGTHVGAGVRFGAQQRYELGYRFQHLSHAGIGHDDNPGINYNLVRLAIAF